MQFLGTRPQPFEYPVRNVSSGQRELNGSGRPTRLPWRSWHRPHVSCPTDPFRTLCPLAKQLPNVVAEPDLRGSDRLLRTSHILNSRSHRDENAAPVLVPDVEQPSIAGTNPCSQADRIAPEGRKRAGPTLNSCRGARGPRHRGGYSAHLCGRPHRDDFVPRNGDHRSVVLTNQVSQQREDGVQCPCDAFRAVRTPLDEILADRGGLGDVQAQHRQLTGRAGVSSERL